MVNISKVRDCGLRLLARWHPMGRTSAIHPLGGDAKPVGGSLRSAKLPASVMGHMPNPWTGKGNPYSRKEVIDRLRATLRKGQPIIAAGAGTGISAKFIEKGGADLIIIYNSGRFRMSGHGSTCGLMAYGDANAVAMESGEYEVLPVV